MTSPLVTVDWLKAQLTDPNLVILDATMKNAVVAPEKLDGYEFIVGARHFDIDGDFCDTSAKFPHTIASESQFTESAQKLGINQDSLVVVYDARGVYSAPRAWWLLTAMGLTNVKLLDGGLPAWKNADGEVQPVASQSDLRGNFVAKLDPNKVFNAEDVLGKIDDESSLTIDVRGPKRFSGEAPEPRAGVRQGHIPGAINVPFNQVLSGTHFKSPEAIKTLLAETEVADNKSLVFSCGSGITACIVLFAANLVGYNNLALFDGSWTEWGSRHELPIA